MKKRKNNILSPLPWEILALFGVCVLMILSHGLYVSLSRQYPVWDENHYMSLALGYYDLFHTNIQNIFSSILTLSDYRQPLYGFILSLPLFLFTTVHAYKIALFTNVFFYIATIIGTYMLAREFFSRSTSLLAALVYAWYGNVLFYLHFTYSETAVTTWIVWAIIFLIRSDFFRNRTNVLLAASMTACAALTRWIAPPFLIGPIVVCGIGAAWIWIKQKKQRKNISINLLLFLGIAIVLPVILYYIPNSKSFGDYVSRNRVYGPEWVAQFKYAEMANPFSTRSVMFYFNIISQNTVFLMVPFIIGCIVAVWYIKRYIYLLISFLSVYGFLTVFAIWKEDRFIVPIYPIMAVITVVFIDYIKQKYLRIGISVLIGMIALISFFGAVWGYGPMGKRGLTDIVLPSFIHHPRRIYLTPLVWTPNIEYSNAHMVTDAIGKDWRGTRPANLVKTFVYDPVDNAVGAILTYEKRTLAKMVSVPVDFRLATDKEIEFVRSADYILTKNTPLPETIWDARELLTVIPVPIDNSMMYLYAHREN